MWPLTRGVVRATTDDGLSDADRDGGTAALLSPVLKRRFNGEVKWVEIDVGAAAEDADHNITEEGRYRVAIAIQ